MIGLLLVMTAAPDCKRPAPDAQVTVSLKKGSTLEDLARVASATLCEPWPAAGKAPLTLAVDGTVLGKQLPALFRLLSESAGVQGSSFCSDR